MESDTSGRSRKRKASQVDDKPAVDSGGHLTSGAAGGVTATSPLLSPNSHAEGSGNIADLPLHEKANAKQSGEPESPTSTQSGASQAYPRTFRLRGIPQDCGADGIPDVFKKTVGFDTDVDIKVHSLASDPLRPSQKVATLEFSKVPVSICAEAAKDGWPVVTTFQKVGGRRRRNQMMILDSHFHGFTPLHSSEDSKCDVDLVAISGLGGHAFGSFKQRDGNFMWLRDALPEDITRTRVFIYGYDTRLQGSTSIKNITDIGCNFLTDIKAIRCAFKSDAERPLILIGHSLGGLIAKEAIIQLSEDVLNEKLLGSILGILFFGVPNQGMNIQSLVPMVGDQPNRYFLETLDRASERLHYQAKQFLEVFSSQCFEIVSFYETSTSPTAEMINGIWRMSGPDAVLVDRISATYVGNSDRNGQNVYAIDRTHSDMVKFPNTHDRNYNAVMFHLRRLEEGADTRKALLQKLTGEQEACLKSLAIKEQVRRLDQIEPAEDTCNWLVDHSSYYRWISQPQGLLWIKGKPGAGKSTIMKYMLGDVERLLSEEAVFIASFFVYAQGKQMQKTTHGLISSLLHQLFAEFLSLPAFQNLTNIFLRRCHIIGPHRKSWNWSSSELKDTLRSALEQASQYRPLVVLVDALDELGTQDATEVIDFFQNTIRLVGKNSSLRICFACRHYPTLALDECLRIVVEEQSDRDIHTVVKRKLCGIPGAQDLETLVVEKANGIFQWADLVVGHIRQKHLQGSPRATLGEVVKRFPGDLHSLYSTLLRDSTENKSQTIRLFQWICFANESLSPDLLLPAIVVDADIPSRSIEEYMIIQELGSSETEVERKIRYLSKGLVEISRPKNSEQKTTTAVHFIHQSVPDYLLSCGFGELDCSLQMRAVERGHLQLARTCIQYFNMNEIEAVVQHIFCGRPEELKRAGKTVNPFLSYALDNWADHGKLAESLEEGPDCLLKPFIFPKEPFEHNENLSTIGLIFACTNCGILSKQLYFGWYQKPHLYADPIVHLLAKHGMVRTLELLKRRTNISLHINIGEVDDEEEVKWPLSEAVIAGQIEIVEFLLRFPEVDVNCTSGHLKSTPLHEAVSYGYQEMLQRLLDAVEVDPDPKDSLGRTPLSYATENENLLGVELLLKHPKVDPDSRDEVGRSPLSYAAEEGNIRLMHLFLGGGKVDPGAKDDQNVLNLDLEMSYVPLPLFLNKENKGHTPLHYAAAKGHADAVKLLLETGVDPEAKSTLGLTPLTFAAHNGCVEVMHILLGTESVNPDAWDALGGSPLLYTVMANDWRGTCADAVVKLLDTGKVALDAKDTSGRTPISYIAEKRHLSALRCLLSRQLHFDLTSKDTSGKSPVDYARRSLATFSYGEQYETGHPMHRKHTEAKKVLEALQERLVAMEER